MEQDGIVYRLHRLAEVGYCAEFGRYPNERNLVRLTHPYIDHAEAMLEPDGSLIVPFGGDDAFIDCASASDTDQFERFIRSVERPSRSWKSMYVWEARLHIITITLFGVVGGLAAGFFVFVLREGASFFR